MLPVFRAMVSAGQPRSLLAWLQRSDGAGILHELAAGMVPLDHDGLDRLPRSGAVDFVRHVLVAAGVLPERPEQLARLDRWLDELLVDKDHASAHLVRTFAHWWVFRRLRFKAERDPSAEMSTKQARSRIGRALEFLEWLEDRGSSLGDCRQDDVDRWLAGATTTRFQVRDFLQWSASRGLAPRFVVPSRQMISPAGSIDDEHRWRLARRLLEEEAVGLDLRVAGLFVVVYGQHLSRVARMRVAAVSADSERVSVCFGSEPVVLPESVGGLVRRLLTRRSPTAFETEAGRRWLFPGGSPGRPFGPENLRQRLRPPEVGRERPLKS